MSHATFTGKVGWFGSKGIGLVRRQHLQRCVCAAEGMPKVEAFFPHFPPFRVLYHVVC